MSAIAANAVVNVPLSDTIAVRASGSYRKEGGFIDFDRTAKSTPFGNRSGPDTAKNINGAESYGGRASLLFKPSDEAQCPAQRLAAEHPHGFADVCRERSAITLTTSCTAA